MNRRRRRKESVYFCENACASSWSGCVDEDSLLTEQEIAELIRYGNPGLYEKLGGLTRTSTYLASDEPADIKKRDPEATHPPKVDLNQSLPSLNGHDRHEGGTHVSASKVERSLSENRMTLEGSGEPEDFEYPPASFVLGRSLLTSPCP